MAILTRSAPLLLLLALGCSEKSEDSEGGGQGGDGDVNSGEPGAQGKPDNDSPAPVASIGPTLDDTSLYDFCSDDDVSQLEYDVQGDVSLAELLEQESGSLATQSSLAVVLINGTSLVEADLQTIASINQPTEDGGAGLTELTSLGLCNLETLSTEAFRDLDEGWLEYLYMDSLLAVEAFAFAGSDNGTTTSLKGISMNSVLTIGEAAFQWGSLEELMLPNVQSIEIDAFRDNYRMLEVFLPKVETLADAVFDDNTHLVRATFPELTMVGRNVFDDNHELVEINMPKVTYLGKSFFGSCYSLEAVHFPSVVTVDDNAFDNCEFLTSVSLPAAKDIRNRVFSECVSLRELSLPQVTNFMNDVFLTCTNDTHPIPNTCCQLESVHLPLVESIGSSTFSGCTELERVVLGDTPPTVGADAFNGTPTELTVYHGGNTSDWSDFSTEGNTSAAIVNCASVSAEVCEG